MKKLLLIALTFFSCILLFSCEDDDSKCPKGEIEFELGNGTTTCIPDLRTPVIPEFPNTF